MVHDASCRRAAGLRTPCARRKKKKKKKKKAANPDAVARPRVSRRNCRQRVARHGLAETRARAQPLHRAARRLKSPRRGAQLARRARRHALQQLQ
eukprot:9198390-Pyramimonas_sp.AAC.1